MKKILIFSTAYYPFVGGAEIAIKEITDRIPDVEFDLITAKIKKGLPFREKIGNVTVYRLGVGIPILDKCITVFEGWFFVKHLEKKKTYDAYWCMMVTFASGSAYIANIFSTLFLKKKTPIILTLQEGDSEKYLKTKWFGLVNLSWKLSLKRTDVLTVISNYLAERAKRLGYTQEIKLIPNGVDVQKFTKEITLEKKKEIREQWGFSDKDIVLITSSRLNIKNGINHVIEALTYLPDEVKFVVCGEGELRSLLEKTVHDLHLKDRVLFLGVVSHDVLPKYLKASDIFIRPSLSEGMGNSFIEAMAAGIPVIATQEGGIADFLFDPEKNPEHEATGRAVAPKDPRGIARAVMLYVENPATTKLIIHNAKTMVFQKYDWNQIAKDMHDKVFSIV